MKLIRSIAAAVCLASVLFVGRATATDLATGFIQTVASDTSDIAVTGLGFQPNWVLLIGENTNANETFATFINHHVGAATGTTAALMESTHASADHNTATSGTRRQQDSDAAYEGHQGGSTGSSTTAKLTLKSFDADGFTVAVPVKDGNARKIFYIAGLADNAKLVTDTTPTTASSKTHTGAGFQPNAAIIFSVGESSLDTFTTQLIHSFGIVADADDGTGHRDQACVSVRSDDAVGTSDTHRVHRSNRCWFVHDGSGGTADEGQANAFTADGLTIDYDTVAGTALYVNILFLDYPSAFVESFAGDGTGSQSLTAEGFAPDGMVFVGSGLSTLNSISAGNQICIGGDDATTGVHAWGSDEDGVGTMNGDRHHGNTYSLFDGDFAQAAEAEGNLSDIDTIAWNTTNTLQWSRLALGPAAPPAADTGLGLPLLGVGE